MSDVMLFGVLRMPYELAMGDELSRRQFHARAQEAADRLEVAEKDAARLNLELQKRDKCSYMGPMRDCPTHGEGAELKAMREAMTKEPT